MFSSECSATRMTGLGRIQSYCEIADGIYLPGYSVEILEHNIYEAKIIVVKPRWAKDNYSNLLYAYPRSSIIVTSKKGGGEMERAWRT